jgi:RNA polymerase sigma-70 factor (ECF subfamily)
VLSSTSSAIESALAEARSDVGVLGKLLQRYYNYLRLIAAAQLGRGIARRVSPSDVVQEVMLAAHRDFGGFQGSTAEEFAAWLRTILSRALIREFERHLTAEKRDLRREISLDAVARDLESSCAMGASLVSATVDDPATIVSVAEESRRIADLVARLPDDYQQVVILKNFGGLENHEIARRMNRSEQAIRLLWMRALRRLRQLFVEESSE